MSTSIDVYKIPNEYKHLSCFEFNNVDYDENYLINTLCGFDKVNIITELFDITFDKYIPLSDSGGLFNACYLITCEEFLKAKTTYYNDFSCNILKKEYGIKKEDYNYIHEELENFFSTIDPVIQEEEKLFFDIG